ncbi:MAG: glycoside hydrolase family 55 protein [Anaerolineae bacterium]|nr:glycoside hydrolase family 55 protein [Anaerolineae bacterium]
MTDRTAVIVSDFGARGDGVADDTPSFQAALDAAAVRGERVLVPAGQFRISGTLSIPPGVTLEGVWAGPHTSMVERGTVLLAYDGRDDETSTPFISLTHNSTLKGVTIYYPEQLPQDIHPYPWTIQGRGQHYNVIDVTLANAYNGIDCGTYHNEGHHLRNVLACCLRRGVLVDQCTDIGRLENVHIHSVYWWRIHYPERSLTREEVDAVNNYTLEHLEGFIIGRTDWEYISNSFVIWAKVGFRFVHTDTPAGGTGNAVITQSGSDIGPLAVLVEEVQSHAGVAFENCQFMSGFNIAPQNRGPVKLSNCGFWGRAGAGSQMVLRGSGAVFLTATHFSAWDQAREGMPCVDARAGKLFLNGVDFMDVRPTGPHIALGSDVTYVSIVGASGAGNPLRLANTSAADIQILGPWEDVAEHLT